MEDLRWLAAKLPEQMDSFVMHWTMNAVYDEQLLGHGVMLFHRENVTVAPPLKRTMTPEDWREHIRKSKNRWAAMCTCSLCEETFLTGYVPGGRRKNPGICLAQGEDGCTYTALGDEALDAVYEADNTVYHAGEGVMCPVCGADVELTPRSELRHGRTWQVLLAEVQVIDGYAAVIYWMVSRHIDDIGNDGVIARPRDALVIDRDGRLRRFSHATHGQFGERQLDAWAECRSIRDPAQVRYYSWGAANNRQVGSWVYAPTPDLTGSTGEKSALDVYVTLDGAWPGVYLQLWRKYRSVENLMRGGFHAAVIRAVDDALDQAIMHSGRCELPAISWADWREVKPHRMLHMSKAAYRALREKNRPLDWVKAWDRYRTVYRTEDAAAFDDLTQRLGGPKQVTALLEMAACGWSNFEVPRVARYLEKQDALQDGVQHLIDYRKMLHNAGMAETEETLWPRTLTEAHDRMVAYCVARGTTLLQQSFTETATLYRDLEWTDGELCVRLPRSEEDLKAEGRVLRHCVGTYGQSHISGKPIFFVRKYRRPERSYYTLNIDMNGEIPREVQLHGYGNERHGERKQYTHNIPQKVRDFVDRWEREVLMPWWTEQKRAERLKEEKKRKVSA